MRKLALASGWIAFVASCAPYAGVTSEPSRDASATDARVSASESTVETDATTVDDLATVDSPVDVASSETAAGDASAQESSIDANTVDAGEASVTVDAGVALDAGEAAVPTDATRPGDGAVLPDAATDDAATVAADVVTVTDDAGIVWQSLGSGACHPRQREVARQLAAHVDPDAGAIAWLTNPPSSGPHFPTWARWGVWDGVPRGNWVHNLEHGGVVMLHQCPTVGACSGDRDALAAIVGTLPDDPSCTLPVHVRVVVDDDPLIETRIAAAAWGWLYAAECVDAPSLTAFYTQHHGMAPEDFCGDGFVP